MSIKTKLGWAAILVTIGIVGIALWFARPAKPIVTPWTAEAQATMQLNETLVTGGWIGEEGKQTLVFIRPQIDSVSTNMITLTIIYGEAHPEAWKSLDAALMKANTNRSSVEKVVLNNEKADLILESLKRVSGANILTPRKLMVSNDRRAIFSVAERLDGQKEQKIEFGKVDWTGTMTYVHPRLLDDSTHLDLAVQVQMNLSNKKLNKMNWLDRVLRSAKLQ